jgi:hypothetical protein
MDPSWTFPIPQAMQQHRGSQTRKPDIAQPNEATLVPADSVMPVVSAPSEATHGRGELIWG